MNSRKVLNFACYRDVVCWCVGEILMIFEKAGHSDLLHKVTIKKACFAQRLRK